MPEFLAVTYAPCDAPGAAEIALATGQASQHEAPVRFLGAILVPDEETCFWLYQALSASAVRAAMTLAGLRPERITPAVPVRPPQARPDPAPRTPHHRATRALTRRGGHLIAPGTGRHDGPAGPLRPPRGQAPPSQPGQDRPGPALSYSATHPSLPSGGPQCPQPPDHRSPARTARPPTTWHALPACGSLPCTAGGQPTRSGWQAAATRSRQKTPDEPACLWSPASCSRRARC